MSDNDERTERLKSIAMQMDEIIRRIGPDWIKLGHLKKEAESIISELGDVDGK